MPKGDPTSHHRYGSVRTSSPTCWWPLRPSPDPRRKRAGGRQTPSLHPILISLVLVAACNAVSAQERPVGLWLAEHPYRPGAFEILDETRDFIVVQYGYERQYRKANLAKRKLRYLVYPDHAIPYRHGVAQPRLKLERVVEYPYRRLRLASAAALVVCVWQGVEYWRARDEVRDLVRAGWSEEVIRDGRADRRRSAARGTYAAVGGAATWIISLRTRRFVRLGDGTTFGFRVGF